jgi:hypothetical protein
VDKNTEVRLEKDSEYKSKTRVRRGIGHSVNIVVDSPCDLVPRPRATGAGTLLASMHLYEKR